MQEKMPVELIKTDLHWNKAMSHFIRSGVLAALTWLCRFYNVRVQPSPFALAEIAVNSSFMSYLPWKKFK